MNLVRLSVITGLFMAPAPWPPALQQVADESPALSPDAELKTFVLPPGYRVELVASEPMVQEPVAIDWDADGRCGSIEMLGYMQDLPATNERAPIGRVSVLEDTNRDGRMDKKTVFLDGLVLPRALKVLDKGVLVGEPPHLWLARDTNGDLKADSKTWSATATAARMANVEHNQNGLLWAMDNWIHTSEGDTYFRFKNGKIRDAEDPVARPVGRDAGRFRSRLSQLEQLGAAYRSGARRRTSCAIPISSARAAATSSWAIRPN